MPRQARLDLPGRVYHVIARGIERTDIFRDDQDRERFVSRLGELIAWGGARLYAWCLLSNHFHLLVRRGEQPLSVLMRRLMTGHAVRFNLRHGRAGHLFQNRYKSIVVEEEPYLLQAVRYIHLNPVRAGMVREPEELEGYLFAGHGALAGARAAPVWQEVDDVLARFAAGRKVATRRYREFVLAGWDEGHRHEFTGGGLVRSAGGTPALAARPAGERAAADERILGSGAFVEEVWREEGGTSRAVPARGWEEVLAEVAGQWEVAQGEILGKSKQRKVSRARRAFLARAHTEANLSGATLARICRMSHSAVQEALAKGDPER